MKKRLTAILCGALMAVSAPATVFAGAWQNDGQGYWYQDDDGGYLKDTWMTENGLWYYFNGSGYMQTGWALIGDTWYYFEESGSMRTSDLIQDGVTYHFNADGSCANPQGEAPEGPASDGRMTMEEYADAFTRWQQQVNGEMIEMQTQLDTLPVTDYAGRKKILEDVKAPFIGFSNVKAPQKFAKAQEKLKAGCDAMVEYADLCIELLDIFEEGRELTIQQSEEYWEKLADAYERAINNLNEGMMMLLEA